MPLSDYLICGFLPIYADLDNCLGEYVIEQGLEPYIVLNIKIKSHEAVAEGVAKTLFNFHENLADIYKLFPLRVLYEDIIPPEAVPLPEPGPDIIIFARTSRRWSYPVTPPQGFRLIG